MEIGDKVRIKDSYEYWVFRGAKGEVIDLNDREDKTWIVKFDQNNGVKDTEAWFYEHELELVEG